MNEINIRVKILLILVNYLYKTILSKLNNAYCGIKLNQISGNYQFF